MQSKHVALLLVLAFVGACASKSGTAGSSSTAPRAPRPSTGAAPWLAPPNPLDLARRTGLELQRKESFTFHIHAHLDIYINGEPVTVPGGLGIDIHDPGVRHAKLPGGG